jgi:DNA-binding transcriptional ArsR family regulator
VRIRIGRVLATGPRTTRQLAAELPDVPQASLYRHLAALVAGGVLEVAAERPVRGTLERVYRLAGAGMELSPDALAHASPDDHLRYFTAFVSSLLAEFARYVQRDRIDPIADGVGYHQIVLQLDDAEFVEFAGKLGELVRPLLANGPRPGRTPRLFATVVLPAGAAPSPDGGAAPAAGGTTPEECADPTRGGAAPGDGAAPDADADPTSTEGEEHHGHRPDRR